MKHARSQQRYGLLPVTLLCLLALIASACGKKVTGGTGATPTTTGSAGSGSEAMPGVVGNIIKVGDLHSLSGTMAISEVAVKNAELLAIDEVNAAGGVLGKQLQMVTQDGDHFDVEIAPFALHEPYTVH